MIQLTGYSPENLSRISYDLTNASGAFNNQQVLVKDQFYDTGTAEFTTNYFQAFDMPLTNGLNVITLHAADLAGNMTTISTNIYCTTNANLPVVTLLWPQDGMQISGNSFTIQGQVSDPTATVTLTSVDANGNTSNFNGRTGRDGIFWIENVPLNAGTTSLALTLNNAAGGTTTNFSLVQSGVGLTVNAVQAGDTTAEVTIDTDGYTVWVNGVPATDNGDGTWTASITPIGIGGGLVQVTAIPNDSNTGNNLRAAGRFSAAQTSGQTPSVNTQATVQPPQGVFFSAYHYNVQMDYLLMNPNEDDYWALDWQDGQGGNEVSFDYADWQYYTPKLDEHGLADEQLAAGIDQWRPNAGQQQRH